MKNGDFSFFNNQLMTLKYMQNGRIAHHQFDMIYNENTEMNFLSFLLFFATYTIVEECSLKLQMALQEINSNLRNSNLPYNFSRDFDCKF